MPDFAASDTATTAERADNHSFAEDGSRPARGHIGLVVLSSIAVGFVVQIAKGQLARFHRCGDLLGLHARALQRCHRSHAEDVARAKRLFGIGRSQDSELNQTLQPLHWRARSLGQLLQRERQLPRTGVGSAVVTDRLPKSHPEPPHRGSLAARPP
jgi:hypothetical protein